LPVAERLFDSVIRDRPANLRRRRSNGHRYCRLDGGNINCDFCKVVGIVKPQNPSSPNLEFEVNLPLNWNRRALQMGGGCYERFAGDRSSSIVITGK
jgi:hypothetical protein